MVHLEEARKRRRGGKGSLVLSKRNEIWRALDGQLAALGKTDAEAFSELMMDQDVVLEDVTNEELREIAQAAEGVVETLRREADTGHRDEAVAAGLIFELEEMQSLLSGLRRRTRRDAKNQSDKAGNKK